MSKRLILILALAFVFGITAATYAEVQNVKVSGDLLITCVDRQQFDLDKGVKGDAVNDSESMFLSQIRLRVDADLTDNVATTVRLINERNWDTESTTNTDIDLDLAYVTLKEFLYSPLTLTMGRQELRFGNALIIGNARTYGNTSSTTVLGGVPSDLSLRKAFDAMRATLDYDPLIIDVLYAKIDESNNKRNEDTDIYGLNASYDIGRKGAKVDLYGYEKKDSTTDKRDKIRTIGTLLSATPIENLKTSLEFAYQFGHSYSAQHKKRAKAFQAMATYDIKEIKQLDKYAPQVGVGYTYLSGDGNSADTKDKAWDRLYYDQALNNITYAILPFSNLNVINLKGSLKPMEDVTVSLNYGYYRLNSKVSTLTSVNTDGAGNTYTYTMKNDEKDLGNAVDLSGIYDYTEDVQLALTMGYFKPGKAFAENYRRQATELIGSMKVTF